MEKAKKYIEPNYYLISNHEGVVVCGCGCANNPKPGARFLPKHTDGHQQILEIKPNWNVNNEINQAKFSAAKEYCNTNNLEFGVWTENQLFS